MTKLKDPIEHKRWLNLVYVLLTVVIGTPTIGFFFGGLDFAQSVLLGCGIVAANFYITQRLITKIVLEKKAPFGLLVWYLMKVAFSVWALFMGVIRWKMDPLGLVIGLSSVVAATMISSVFRVLHRNRG